MINIRPPGSGERDIHRRSRDWGRRQTRELDCSKWPPGLMDDDEA
jgi:hypothetical protein